MSHYPFYCTGCYAKNVAALWYSSAGAERKGNGNMTEAARGRMVRDAAQADLNAHGDRKVKTGGGGWGWEKSVAAGQAQMIGDLIPILTAGGMDAFMAGHWHYYESLWPAANGADGTGGQPLQKNFVDPAVCIHVTQNE